MYLNFASCPLVATADFACIRFHGSGEIYSGSYADGELTDWAKRLAGLTGGLSKVYIYFNNDVVGFALKNATTLRRHLQEVYQ